LDDLSTTMYLLVTISSIILLLPIIFRYSRILFLHLFGGISFDSSVIDKNC
jgi:hypothetical protein